MWNVVHRHPGQGQAHGSSSDARETVMLVPPSASRRRSVLVSWCRRMCERRAELDANSVEQCGHRSRGASSAPEDIAVVPRDSGSARLSGWGLARLKCRQRGAGWPTGRDNGAWQHPRTKAAARGWWEGVRVRNRRAKGCAQRRASASRWWSAATGAWWRAGQAGAAGACSASRRWDQAVSGAAAADVRLWGGWNGGRGRGRAAGGGVETRRDETRRRWAGLGWV